MRARIDISEVEARTKIRAKYLRAIENEEWDLLPGPVYVKSFLRTYGDYLGLDSRMLVDEFKRRYERPSDHDVRPVASLTARERERMRGAPRGGRRFHIPPQAVIGLILVCVVVALYVIGSGSGAKPPAINTRTASHQRTKSTTKPVVKPKPAAPTSATLELTPTGAVYVCVESHNGKQLIPGVIYNAGQTIPTERRRELLVTLGNASVQLKVNGKSYPVAQSSTAIGLKVTPAGVSPLPAGQDPTCT